MRPETYHDVWFLRKNWHRSIFQTQIRICFLFWPGTPEREKYNYIYMYNNLPLYGWPAPVQTKKVLYLQSSITELNIRHEIVNLLFFQGTGENNTTITVAVCSPNHLSFWQRQKEKAEAIIKLQRLLSPNHARWCQNIHRRKLDSKLGEGTSSVLPPKNSLSQFCHDRSVWTFNFENLMSRKVIYQEAV